MLSVGVSRGIWRIGPQTEFRLGGLVGLAYYGELSMALEDEYGLPNFGGVIPIIGLGTILRHGRFELRLTMVPPGTDVDAIVNLSMTLGL